jgi:hypothetical protein
MITTLNTARRKKNLDLEEHKHLIDNFIREFGLLDFRDYRVVTPEQAA